MTKAKFKAKNAAKKCVLRKRLIVQTPVIPTHEARVKDPLMELLAVLRMNPSESGIQNIVQYVEDERKADFINLGKAVRDIMGRTLTEQEEILVKKLGSNTGRQYV
jgi:hypothetical protein